MSSPEAIRKTLSRGRERLLAEREAGGWWKGELSSSALSTATACTALSMAGEAEDQGRVRAAQAWLAAHQNADGGYGDTVDSPSNLSTSALAWMALGQGSTVEGESRSRVALWLRQRLGGLGPKELAKGLREVYADDHTFAVPIQVACTAGGCFDKQSKPWRAIPRLPYELAALPGVLFKWLGLPVVSYALPALIAIGQAIESQRPSRNPLTRCLRWATRGATLRKLERIQPHGGGYLEATPLTSFVVLSLVSCGQAGHAVVREGLGFLRNSMRADGSWPIDSDLATWLSTLAINALAANGDLEQHLDEHARQALGTWLHQQQHQRVHAYTGAAPGGWAWTPLPGGVPDADDTPGALLALANLGLGTEKSNAAAALWLCDLQNKDGGMPTFCKGWGRLPFDASCPDLSAHALRAWHRVGSKSLSAKEVQRLQGAQARTREYLMACQEPRGTWVPLWFGNQHTPQQTNPVYGTSRVLRAVHTSSDGPWRAALQRALTWLLSAQNTDGGFGGDVGISSTLEETGLALEALGEAAKAGLAPQPSAPHNLLEAMRRGAEYLAEATCEGTQFDPQPIGLYFAKLWYSERLYPLIFSVSALELCQPYLVGATVPR